MFIHVFMVLCGFIQIMIPIRYIFLMSTTSERFSRSSIHRQKSAFYIYILNTSHNQLILLSQLNKINQSNYFLFAFSLVLVHYTNCPKASDNDNITNKQANRKISKQAKR